MFSLADEIEKRGGAVKHKVLKMAEDYKPSKNKQSRRPLLIGVLGWIDNRLPLTRILLKEYIVFCTVTQTICIVLVVS